MRVAVTWGTFLPNLDALGLWVLEAFAMYATDKGAGSYLAGMAVAIPILNVDGRRHTNNFSKNI